MCEREVEAPNEMVAYENQSSEAGSGALPLVVPGSNLITAIVPIENTTTYNLYVQPILDQELHVEPNQANIWTPLDDYGRVLGRMMIQQTL